MLDVLELHAIGAPDEERERVRSIDDVGDLEPTLLGLGDVLVDSVEQHVSEAEELGLEIADVVDAPNTLALFVWGPDRVKLEYVEHKPSFSLT